MKIELDNKIVIILKYGSGQRFNNSEIPQGYVVSRFNARQLESAREWGATYEQTEFGTTRKIEPKEIVLDNEGFEVDIVEAAGQSSQGGKLSFWNCIISQGETKMLIGIDQTSLLSLIRQSTIVNGVVTQRCSLYKNNTAGAIHKDMAEWGGLSDDSKKSARKTVKYIPGRIYATKTTRAIYMGKVYSWYTKEAKIVDKNMIYEYKPLDKPVEKHLFLDIDYSGLYKSIESGTIKSLEDLYSKLESEMEKPVKNSSNVYELYSATKLFGYYSLLLSKPVPREELSLQLDGENSTELMEKYILKLKTLLYEYQGDIQNMDNIEFVLFSSANNEEFNRPADYIEMLSSKLCPSMRILSGEDTNN